MKTKDKAALGKRKSTLEARLDPGWGPCTSAPVLGRASISYEVADRVNAISCGGIGLMSEMVRSLGLSERINERVRVFKRRKPYHESDHVLNMAYNTLSGGTCIEDIDLVRNNVAYLDAIGCHRIPDPTTAGDFLRRLNSEERIWGLMEAINDVRPKVWKELPRSERKLALIDVDGTIAPTLGECKEGTDFAYTGAFGYHPLVVTLANTQEVLYTKNRPGNRPSHDDSQTYMDAAVALVRGGGFERARLRGDTDFALTSHFDRWTGEGVEFVFGIDAHQSFKAKAAEIPEKAWKRLERQPLQRRGGRIEMRTRPTNVKDKVIRERGFKTITTEREHIAEITYRPGKSDRDYRMIVVRKTIRVTAGQLRLEDEVRYFFYVTNVPPAELSSRNVVFQANARCNQENVIEQLKNGVRAMRMPSSTSAANWAYLVIVSLAWNLKAWLAILAPPSEQTREIRRMEFRRFLNSVMLIPTQVIKTGRKVVLRLLAWTPFAETLLEGLQFFKRKRPA